MAWVELLGLGGGIGRTAVLHKGETLTYKDLEITFANVDLSGFDPDASQMSFGVVFEVVREGVTHTVVPRFRSSDGQPVITPAVIPDTGGVSLGLGRIDPEGGTMEVQVLDPYADAAPAEPASLVLDVSTKPLIGLVWLGTILIMVGVVLAMATRRREVAGLAVGGEG